jgi:hypothetical protein
MLLKQLTSFGIYLDEQLITELRVSSKDMLGITIHQVPIPGIVPFYEEHDARVDSGYTLTEWYNLDGRDRALEVALYRIRHAIEYQKVKAQERQMERDSKRK